MDADTAHDPKERERAIVQAVLRVGLAASLALLASGMIVAAVAGASPGSVRLFDLLGPLDLGSRLMALGALTLGMTPVARVVVLLALWLRERDLVHAAIAAVVLATLALAIVLGSPA